MKLNVKAISIALIVLAFTVIAAVFPETPLSYITHYGGFRQMTFSLISEQSTFVYSVVSLTMTLTWVTLLRSRERKFVGKGAGLLLMPLAGLALYFGEDMAVEYGADVLLIPTLINSLTSGLPWFLVGIASLVIKVLVWGTILYYSFKHIAHDMMRYATLSRDMLSKAKKMDGSSVFWQFVGGILIHSAVIELTFRMNSMPYALDMLPCLATCAGGLVSLGLLAYNTVILRRERKVVTA